MSNQRKDWEAREPEFSKEEFENDENWFIGVIFGIMFVAIISTFYIVTHI